MLKKYFLPGLIAVGLFGVWGVAYATKWGPGLIDWDSFNYISAARNLATGKGLTIPLDPESNTPMTHYPPLFPVVLAGFELLSMDAMTAARWLNAALFGVTAALLGLTVRRITRSEGLGLAAALAFVLARDMVVAFAYALAEPLLLALTAGSLWYLGKYLEEEELKSLLLASLLAAGAFLTKYGGAANVIAVGVGALAVGKKRFWSRLGWAALAVGVGTLPGSLWTLRNYLLTGTFNNRALGSTALLKQQWVKLYFNLYGWLVPFQVLDWNEKVIIISSVLIAGGMVALFLYDHYRTAGKFTFNGWVKGIDKTAISYLIFGAAYAAVVIASKVYVDPAIPFDSRIWSPLFLCLMVVLMYAAKAFLRHGARWRRAAVGIGLVYLAVYSAAGFAHTLPTAHRNGLGLNRRGVLQAESVGKLVELSGQEMVFSDYPTAMYLLTGQTGYKFAQLKETPIPAEGAVFASFRAIAYGQDYVEAYRDYLSLLVKDKIAAVYWYLPP